MNTINEKKDRGSWIIGGTTLVGIAVGFVFLAMQYSSLLLVASVLAGIGIGLVISSLMSRWLYVYD